MHLVRWNPENAFSVRGACPLVGTIPRRDGTEYRICGSHSTPERARARARTSNVQKTHSTPETERARARAREGERGRESERERACVCVCARARVRKNACDSERGCARERPTAGDTFCGRDGDSSPPRMDARVRIPVTFLEARTPCSWEREHIPIPDLDGGVSALGAGPEPWDAMFEVCRHAAEQPTTLEMLAVRGPCQAGSWVLPGVNPTRVPCGRASVWVRCSSPSLGRAQGPCRRGAGRIACVRFAQRSASDD